MYHHERIHHKQGVVVFYIIASILLHYLDVVANYFLMFFFLHAYSSDDIYLAKPLDNYLLLENFRSQRLHMSWRIQFLLWIRLKSKLVIK